MQLLMVVPSLPLPFGATAGRWIYLLVKELAWRDVRIRLLAITESTARDVADAMDQMRPFGVEVIPIPLTIDVGIVKRKLRSLRQPHSEYLMCGAATQAFRRLALETEHIHVETLFPARLLGSETRPASVHIYQFDELDWMNRPYLDWSATWARMRAKRAARQIVPSLGSVIVHSDRVAQHVVRLAPASTVECLPLAIDTRLYPFRGCVPRNRLRAGVIGSMSWYPSANAARNAATKVWPLVRAQLPGSCLTVAGWHAARYLSDLAGLDNVELQADLPSPEVFFEGVDVLLYVPSEGSGTKIKVLEALAYGVPVVTNRYGVEGIAPALRQVISVVDSDDEAAAATVGLMLDRPRRQRLAVEGRSMVEHHHGPHVISDSWYPALMQR